MKKEQKAKRAQAQRPEQREAKEVVAELVEKLRGKLELKARSASPAEAGPRAELGPNLDRLTVGVDLGDQWSHYCILGLQGETLSEGRLRTSEAEVAEFFQHLPSARVVMEVGTRHLSRKLCLKGSCLGLETALEHDVELRQSGGDRTTWTTPALLFEA
jgi:hypothetical protein